jgi:hypothetical protein
MQGVFEVFVDFPLMVQIEGYYAIYLRTLQMREVFLESLRGTNPF